MKKYIIPTTETYLTSVNVMLPELSNSVGKEEFSNKTEFDDASELEIDMKQNLWDD